MRLNIGTVRFVVWSLPKFKSYLYIAAAIAVLWSLNAVDPITARTNQDPEPHNSEKSTEVPALPLGHWCHVNARAIFSHSVAKRPLTWTHVTLKAIA